MRKWIVISIHNIGCSLCVWEDVLCLLSHM